ncbi:hypothetical protein [Arthrobacter mangrovi]|uniref:Integral membrane protein n=1 Tax=Arthrobacter mangrovi TaxID=2966350 RepID=A0ABQ5MWA0_9MICC|nr:hypothetical protein [Arthrobacter mangrovi]GLB68271.1 hypothetical protein AHIS1636_27130 [Arthrobacter mangrovi]
MADANPDAVDSEAVTSQSRARRLTRRAAHGVARPAAALLHTYGTEHAIDGTVLVSALIAVGWKYETDLEVFLFTLGTVGVFWLSHIYAGVVAGSGSAGRPREAVWARVLATARHSVGMVLAMLLPAFFLLLAAVGVLDEYVAYYIALWVGAGILAVLGYVNAARRRKRWPLRLLNAAATSALGLIIIWLSTLVH